MKKILRLIVTAMVGDTRQALVKGGGALLPLTLECVPSANREKVWLKDLIKATAELSLEGKKIPRFLTNCSGKKATVIVFVIEFTSKEDVVISDGQVSSFKWITGADFPNITFEEDQDRGILAFALAQ